MPVTKTAKRALRSSEKKALVNKLIRGQLDAAIRIARRDQNEKSVKDASILADRAAKKKVIHKNKAARIKSALAKLIKKTAKPTKKVTSTKKTKTSKK